MAPAFLALKSSPQDIRRRSLRLLAVQAYWAASNPLEAKMAGILLDLFAPDVSERRPRYVVTELNP